MSRIRSLHPGLFTDERYMALSFPARELIKGIWCEADDQGVFEWKPLTLKAKIMPADAVDIVALLAELIAGEFVTRFEIDGKGYGAVRNFRKFQRPKKPNSIHLLPPEFRHYVGLTDDEGEPEKDKSPPVPHQFPTKEEKSPQMEDGGGRMEDGVKEEREKPERSESPTRSLRSPAEYAFCGSVIRLIREDYDRWRESFSAIDDFDAELRTIDAKFVDDGVNGKWFGKAAAWLQAKNKRTYQERKAKRSGAGFGSPGFA